MGEEISRSYRKGGYRLKQIDIEYFKSFGVVTIGPFADFTCVLGPNGTGKSNFLAAVNFAAGADIQTLRHGDRSLINENGGSNFAKVTLLLEKSNDGITVVEEKKFSRVLEANGSGKYFINDVRYPKKEYLAGLNELGITKDMVSGFVKQGAVEKLAMISGKELTNLIETVSGSTALKQEYEDCEKQVEYLQKALKVANSEKLKTATYLREYNRQKTLAKGQKKLDEELVNAVRVQAKMKLWKVTHELADLKTFSEAATAEYNTFVEGETELIESRVRPSTPDQETKKELDEVLIVEATQEKYLKLKEQALKDVSAEVGNMIQSLQPTLRCHEQVKEKLFRLEEDLSKNKSELNEIQQKLSALNSIESINNSEELLKEEMIVEYWKLMIQLETETMDIQTKLVKARDSFQFAEREYKMVNQIETWKTMQVKLKEDEVTACMKEMEALSCKERDLLERLKQLEITVDELKLNESRTPELEKELKKVRTQMQILRYKAASKKDIALTELKETFGDAVIGRIEHLWEPVSERYKLAAHRILGPSREAIIVDTLETACLCADLLQKRELTYEIVLPLQSVLDVPLKDTYRTTRHLNGVSLLYDRLKFDARVEKAIRFLVRNTLVCDTYEIAKHHAWELDPDQREDAVEISSGVLFKADGSVIFGRVSPDFGANDMESLSSRCVDLIQQISAGTQKSSTLVANKEELQTLKDNLQNIRKAMKVQTQVQKEASEKLQQLRLELNAAQAKTRDARANVQRCNRIFAETEKHVSVKQESIFGNFIAKYGTENLRKFYSGDVHQTNREDRSRAKLLEQKTLIESNIRTLESTSEEAKSNESVQNLKLRESSLKKEVDTVRKEFQVTVERKNEMQDILNKSKEDITAELYHVRSLLKQSKVKVADYHTRIQKKEEDKRKLLWKCWSEGIVVGTKFGDEGSEHSFDLDDIENDHVDIDFNELRDEFKNTRAMWDVSIKKCSQHIKNFKQKQKLSGSGNPNKNPAKHTKTIEDAKKASMKAAQVSKELREANTAMKHVANERREKFASCFEKIKKVTEAIYRRLYAESMAEAVLYAVNEESPFLGPINYDCICPGKRLQKMSMLSGGEKTIAALTLLFGILSFRPPPFTIFDEIDAALDKEKLEMLGIFLSGCSEPRDSNSIVEKILLPYPCIAITHQKELMKYAQDLIGVTREALQENPEADPLSTVFTINLSDYQSEPN